MLNKNIFLIKKSIVRSKKLIKNGVPKKLERSVRLDTNCYAYALGITYTEEAHYYPGFTEHMGHMPIDNYDMISSVCLDLKNLGFKYRKINLHDEIKLDKGEYLIKAYLARPNSKVINGDFHFVRKDNESGLWFHKFGTTSPCLTDDNGIEPEEIVEISTDLHYKPIVYFAIKEKTLIDKIRETINPHLE